MLRPDRPTTLRRRALLHAAAGVAAGCATSNAGHGWGSRMRPAPEGVKLEPPPPSGVYWLRVAAADVPPESPDAQPWDEDGPPDPYGVLRIDGETVMTTEPVADSLSPAWVGKPGGNFEIDDDSELEAILRDDDALTDRLIGRGSFPPPSRADLAKGTIRVDIGQMGHHGHLEVAVERAHAVIGLGLDYERFESRVVVSRLMKYGGAARVGMEVGDEIVSVGGTELDGLSPRRIRGLFNGIDVEPVRVIVLHESGTTESFELARGPCYPLFEEYGPVA